MRASRLTPKRPCNEEKGITGLDHVIEARRYGRGGCHRDHNNLSREDEIRVGDLGVGGNKGSQGHSKLPGYIK
jgi:hypothetical protein